MKVVDASAIGAILFDEPSGEALVSRLRSDVLTAPVLIAFEIANICLKKIRARPQEADRLLETFASWHSLDIALQEIDLPEAIVLARQQNLSAYDASYLWLARELGAELVTLDAKLEHAYRALDL